MYMSRDIFHMYIYWLAFFVHSKSLETMTEARYDNNIQWNGHTSKIPEMRYSHKCFICINLDLFIFHRMPYHVLIQMHSYAKYRINPK